MPLIGFSADLLECPTKTEISHRIRNEWKWLISAYISTHIIYLCIIYLPMNDTRIWEEHQISPSFMNLLEIWNPPSFDSPPGGFWFGGGCSTFRGCDARSDGGQELDWFEAPNSWVIGMAGWWWKNFQKTSYDIVYIYIYKVKKHILH